MRFLLLALIWGLLLDYTFVFCATEPQASNVTKVELETAGKIVHDALIKMRQLNKARRDNPARNRYYLKPGTIASRNGGSHKQPPPLLEITEEIARAAALVAEADVANDTNFVPPPVRANAEPFWMAGVPYKGTMPWGDDPSYKVFRNVVTDYGADPTGKLPRRQDSTAAIRKAISDGRRCGERCNGSTTKNAIVYFPPGTYLISSTVQIYFATQIIGDANNWPTLKAAPKFVGKLGLIETNYYVENGGLGPDGLSLEWYVNTARFFSQIRNIRIDVTETDPNGHIAGIHYQAAQAASIEHVEIIAKTGTTQLGMYSENGSGGSMSDVTFTGGEFGFLGGNQQFSATRMTFRGCATAIRILWDWGWVWKSLRIDNVEVGVRLFDAESSDNAAVGSMSFVDSIFSNIKNNTAIILGGHSEKAGQATTGLVLDNVKLDGKIVAMDPKEKEILGPGYYNSFVLGPTYGKNNRTWVSDKFTPYIREQSLLADSPVAGLEVTPYFERERNQYKDKTVSDFIHLKNAGAKGDGVTDDTVAVQKLLDAYADGSKIIYVDSGTYILTKTVTIPKDAKLVGEAWAQFAARGPFFSDTKKPQPMLRVGKSGDEGTVEMQDLIVTTQGPTPGVILMEWNVRASGKGSAALWDVHARVGGAAGTKLTPTECPATGQGVNKENCKVASLLMHITSLASGYFDNMWLWVADHMIDDPDLKDRGNEMTQISLYSARGLLVESKVATWLYGTASEHNIFYQYNFINASNIFTTMIQTESPYFQPKPRPPEPFGESKNFKFPGDPDYTFCNGSVGVAGQPDSGCDASWAVIMSGCENIHIAGAGTYSWFNDYTQDCIDQHSCQMSLWNLPMNHDNNRIQHVIGIGAEYILRSERLGINSTANLAIEEHPSWAQISVFNILSSGPSPYGGTPSLCLEEEKNSWYSGLSMPAGRFFNSLYYDPQVGPNRNEFFITIVNLTPYTFKLDSLAPRTHMSAFEFDDIPPGKARQNRVEYANAGLDNWRSYGEAFYTIIGTNKQFSVRSTLPNNKDDKPFRAVFDLTGMGHGQREYTFPAPTSSTTLVITGSDSFGYISSLTLQPLNWMRSIYPVIKNRQLRHVVMPGSHDAGMSTINRSPYDGFGSMADTQTQGLSIYDQLRVGSRYFDMRIVSVQTNGDQGFWTAHFIKERTNSPFGALGQSLESVVDETNKFMDENPGEVVIWGVRYLTVIGKETNDHGWDEQTAKNFFSSLEWLKYRCADPKTDEPNRAFDKYPVKTFMDQNDGKGCVLILLDSDPTETIKDKPESGIYSGRRLKRDDYWAEQQKPQDTAAAQVRHMLEKPRRLGTEDNFYIMQWQCTPDHSDSVRWGLYRYALMASNPALYFAGVNAMSPTFFPTVIMQDYLGLLVTGVFWTGPLTKWPEDIGAELQVLSVALNLYLVSMNCDVALGQHPYHRKNPREKFASQTSVEDEDEEEILHAPPPFRGVIYSNGTVDENPPLDFHLGREPVYWNGTDLGNGTVLDHDVPNPTFKAPAYVYS